MKQHKPRHQHTFWRCFLLHLLVHPALTQRLPTARVLRFERPGAQNPVTTNCGNTRGVRSGSTRTDIQVGHIWTWVRLNNDYLEPSIELIVHTCLLEKPFFGPGILIQKGSDSDPCSDSVMILIVELTCRVVGEESVPSPHAADRSR